MPKRLTQKYVEQWFIARKAKLESCFVNVKIPIKFQCPGCKEINQVLFSSLVKSYKDKDYVLCRTCSTRNQGVKRRTPLQEVEQFFIEKDVNLIRTFRDSGTVSTIYICPSCNSERIATWPYVRKYTTKENFFCRSCKLADKSSLVLEPPPSRKSLFAEEARQWFIKRNSQLLSEYTNNKLKIKFMCSTCRGQGEAASFGSLKQKYKDKDFVLCKACVIQRNATIQRNARISPQSKIEQWFIERSSKLLSTYVNAKDLSLKFVCTKCNEIVNNGCFHTVKSSYQKYNYVLCRRCANASIGYQCRSKAEDISDWLLKRNSYLFSAYYTNKLPILILCLRM